MMSPMVHSLVLQYDLSWTQICGNTRLYSNLLDIMTSEEIRISQILQCIISQVKLYHANYIINQLEANSELNSVPIQINT